MLGRLFIGGSVVLAALLLDLIAIGVCIWLVMN